MTITLDPAQVVAVVVTTVSVLWVVGRKVRELDKVLHAASAVIHRELDEAHLSDAIDDVRRELNTNHGESMKDDVTGNALAIGYLSRWFDDLAAQVDEITEAHHRKENER